MSKTNLGLVEYAKAQLGRPYWMGTYGNTATPALYTYKKKQLPRYYTATDFSSQYGQRVHDCIGLIKGYIWSDGPDAEPKYASNGCPDINEAQMYANAREKGVISTLPEISGTLVFLPGHVGVYIGGGYVIEARGHAYGVVKTALAGRGWDKWAKCPYIEYVGVNSGTAPTEQAVDVNYQAKVTASTLNCRTKPNGQVITAFPNGTILHIVKEEAGWGYTGLGWVSLDYVQKISETGANSVTQEQFDECMKNYRNKLQDNDASGYSAEARAWAVSNGIFQGGGNLPDGSPNYMWEDLLTREQMAATLYRFAKLIGQA